MESAGIADRTGSPPSERPTERPRPPRAEREPVRPEGAAERGGSLAARRATTSR